MFKNAAPASNSAAAPTAPVTIVMAPANEDDEASEPGLPVGVDPPIVVVAGDWRLGASSGITESAGALAGLGAIGNGGVVVWVEDAVVQVSILVLLLEEL